MTVSSQVNRKDYSGNGSTTNFATEFRFLEDSHLRVILTVDSTGVETVQSITTNYTVTGKGEDSGGTVAMIIAPATGETLTIKRDVPITQQTDYVENDDFPAESHERALDKLTMIVQEQQEELGRSLKLSEGQQSSGLTIPVPDEDKFMQWDADGNLRNVDISSQGSLAVSDFGKTLLNTVDAGTGSLILKVSAAAAGSVDAITANFTPILLSLTNGTRALVRASGANATTTPTFAPNGLAAKPIVKNGNQTLAVGDIFGADHELDMVYNSSNDNWELLNPANITIIAPGIKAHAAVNFNGTGTPAIRTSQNVTNITDLGTGQWNIVMGTAASGTGFTFELSVGGTSGVHAARMSALTSSTLHVLAINSSDNPQDVGTFCATIYDT